MIVHIFLSVYVSRVKNPSTKNPLTENRPEEVLPVASIIMLFDDDNDNISIKFYDIASMLI